MWYSEMKTLTKYDILVVVLNRLYLVLAIGLHTRYGGYRYQSTSRGDGNYLPSFIIFIFFILVRSLFTSRGDNLIKERISYTNRKNLYCTNKGGI